jgi:hypothetical protein
MIINQLFQNLIKIVNSVDKILNKVRNIKTILKIISLNNLNITTFGLENNNQEYLDNII